MKANELRIGNWFIEYDEPQQFDGDFYHLSDIKPIPLTEEWLLKFKFEYCGGYFNLNNVILYIDWNNKYRYQYNYGQRWIKHVHQLQNLYFALTGDELTIKSE